MKLRHEFIRPGEEWPVPGAYINGSARYATSEFSTGECIVLVASRTEGTGIDVWWLERGNPPESNRIDAG